MEIEVLNPVGEVRVEKQTLSAREKNLQGKTVVFFGNAKPNQELLFDHLEKIFALKFPATRTIRKRKENAALPASEGVLREVAHEADWVICGIGD